MKHLAQIQVEFLKISRNWDDIPLELQKAYLGRHPLSHRRLTAIPPQKSQTSGLAIHDPKKSQAHIILNTIKSYIGAADFNEQPIFREYITKRDERANKYHYFTVLKDKEGNFVAANAYGRIGYPVKGIAVLSRSQDPKEAITVAEKKLQRKKDKRGYEITKMM